MMKIGQQWAVRRLYLMWMTFEKSLEIIGIIKSFEYIINRLRQIALQMFFKIGALPEKFCKIHQSKKHLCGSFI